MESRNETNVALIVTDDELQVVNADSLSLEILGKSENQIVGTPLSRLLGGDIRLEVALLSTAMFRARFEEQVIHFHGRDLRVNAIPVTMETGDGAGLFITLENTPEATLAPETTLTPEPEPTLAPHK